VADFVPTFEKGVRVRLSEAGLSRGMKPLKQRYGVTTGRSKVGKGGDEKAPVRWYSWKKSTPPERVSVAYLEAVPDGPSPAAEGGQTA
jgi:hypothetical protein